MKVLFVNPIPNVHKSFGIWHRFMFPIPPAWACYIASYVRRFGHEVSIEDPCDTRISNPELLKRIIDRNPDVMAATCLTQAASRLFPLLFELRKAAPKIKIVLGNIHANEFWQDILTRNLADAVVHGEGEESFNEILNHWERGNDLGGVPGVSYRSQSGEAIRNPARPAISDLDSLPFPAWELVPFLQYKPPLFVNIDMPLLPILATRGCPMQCTFCSVQMGRTYRRRSFANVLDEMGFFLDKYGVRQYGFLDALFPPNKKVGLEFCKELIDRGYHRRFTWATEMRVDVMDSELAEAMAAAGCTRVQYGIEAGDQTLLDNLNKDISLDQITEGIAASKKAGLEVVGLFMLGIPGETKALSKKTISFALSLPLDLAKFPILVPYPGTELFHRYLCEIHFSDEQWENFTSYMDVPVPYPTPWLPFNVTRKDLLRLQIKATALFYLRPKMIWNTFSRKTVRFGDAFKGGLILLLELFRKVILRRKM